MSTVLKEKERYKSERDQALFQLSQIQPHSSSQGQSQRRPSGGDGTISSSSAQQRAQGWSSSVLETAGAAEESTATGRQRAGTVVASGPQGKLSSDSTFGRPTVLPRANSDTVSPRSSSAATLAPQSEPAFPKNGNSMAPSPVQTGLEPPFRARARSEQSPSTQLPSGPGPVRTLSGGSASGSGGSSSAPVSPADQPPPLGSIARTPQMAPSPLSQEVSITPSSSSRISESISSASGQSLLPSAPIGDFVPGMQQVSSSLTDSAGPSSGSGGLTRHRKLSDMPRSPSMSSVEEREGERTRTQSLSTAGMTSSNGSGTIRPSKAPEHPSSRQLLSQREIANSSPDPESSLPSRSSPTPPEHKTSTSTSPSPPYTVNLTPPLLPYTHCDIPTGRIIRNNQGKDVLCFDVRITLRPPGTDKPIRWTTNKLFSAFVELDDKICMMAGGKRAAKQAGVATLPDGRARKDYAPSKADQRKVSGMFGSSR